MPDGCDQPAPLKERTRQTRAASQRRHGSERQNAPALRISGETAFLIHDDPFRQTIRHVEKHRTEHPPVCWCRHLTVLPLPTRPPRSEQVIVSGRSPDFRVWRTSLPGVFNPVALNGPHSFHSCGGSHGLRSFDLSAVPYSPTFLPAPKTRHQIDSANGKVKTRRKANAAPLRGAALPLPGDRFLHHQARRISRPFIARWAANWRGLIIRPRTGSSCWRVRPPSAHARPKPFP